MLLLQAPISRAFEPIFRVAVCTMRRLSCIADPKFKCMFDLFQEAFTSIAGERHSKAQQQRQLALRELSI
jgi:hypothetical protein